MYYIHDKLLEEIESLKESGKYDEALKKVNAILAKDPTNEEALLQVADIQYRKGELDKATKAVDFLNETSKNQDAMGLYVKGVLEMEKNERGLAKKYFKEALRITNFENYEIVRCYGLCEYWYGNREKGISFIEEAFEINKYDAEVIYNLIELYLLEHKYTKAKKMLSYFHDHRDKLEAFEKPIEYYDQKIRLFKAFLESVDGKECKKKSKKALYV